MIKPEFWEDDKIAECSPTARLLFVALWNFADDEGFLENRTKWLKAKCLPYDDVQIEKLLDELSRVGRIEIRGEIIHIKNFLKHQKIDKPRPSDLSQIFKNSANTPRMVGEDSPTKREYESESESEYKNNSSCPKPEISDKPKKIQKKFDSDSVEFQLAKLLLDSILQNNPKFKSPDLQKWAAEVDKMMRLDSRAIQEIHAIILFSQQDIFWRANILSMGKLREKFDQLWLKAKSEFDRRKAQEEKTAFIS